jgi:tetratricopeptide (TPR) repeat protein
MRLNPRSPELTILLQLGDVELVTGNIEAAIDQYRKAYDAGYRGYFLDASLAAAYALEGKMDEAKSALAEARRLNPSLTIKWFREHAEDLPVRSEGLRKAGLPEE